MTGEQLRPRWALVWESYGTRVTGDTVFDALASAYSSPDRHYHNLSHISDCLEVLDRCRSLAGDPPAIEMALWFHDAVYDTHAGDNEEQSAQWAVRELGGGEPAATVRRLILATKHSTEAPTDNDEALIADIDLVIVGSDTEKFWSYDDAIRREYEWVPEAVFRSTRAEILRRFLERERIYQTPYFHDRYDKPARANLRASIDRLS